jgi:hypothetical protein
VVAERRFGKRKQKGNEMVAEQVSCVSPISINSVSQLANLPSTLGRASISLNPSSYHYPDKLNSARILTVHLSLVYVNRSSEYLPLWSDLLL